MGWLIVIGVCAAAILIYRAFLGPPVTSSSRITCPACKESIVSTAMICPHCRSGLSQGAIGDLMEAQRQEIVRIAGEQRHKSVMILSAVLIVFALVVLYVWLAARQYR